MSQITNTAKSTMILAAGTIAGVLFTGSVATTANAETMYFGYETSFRVAKQMCNGMHGRLFETERGQYGCTGDLRARKQKVYIPPAAGPANDRPTKRQNFTGRQDFSTNGEHPGNQLLVLRREALDDSRRRTRIFLRKRKNERAGQLVLHALEISTINSTLDQRILDHP